MSPASGERMGPPGPTFFPSQKLLACATLFFFFFFKPWGFCRIHSRENVTGFEEECCAFGYSFWSQR